MAQVRESSPIKVQHPNHCATNIRHQVDMANFVRTDLYMVNSSLSVISSVAFYDFDGKLCTACAVCLQQEQAANPNVDFLLISKCKAMIKVQLDISDICIMCQCTNCINSVKCMRELLA